MIGISDIAVYLPKRSISLKAIVTARIAEDPSLGKHFQRALALIEQHTMRFPAEWEDPVTMAAESSLAIMQSNPQRQSALRYLVSATETAIDMAKPIAAYVLGCLKKAEIVLQNTLLTYQVQHACAGGSLALLGLGALIQQQSQDVVGLLTCTDIARYEKKTTAELTHGAGSTAVLIEKNPKLLDLDLDRVGMYANDVDDFFRPVWTTSASVRGQYSIECYKTALVGAFEDYARQCEKTPKTILAETDYVIVHVPFAKMASLAVQHLYAQYTEYSTEQIRNILFEKDFFASLQGIQHVGNIYTASIFLALRDQLRYAYKKNGKAIVGQTVLMCSYGSGNTMVCMQGTVKEEAISVIQGWESTYNRDVFYQAGVDEYEAWLNRTQDIKADIFDCDQPADGFSLQSIRDDGYRMYSYAKTNPQT